MPPGHEQRRRAIDEIVALHGGRAEELLPILAAVQRALDTIGAPDIEAIARSLSLRPAQVQAVASFHPSLEPGPRGRCSIRLCRTLSCMLAGRDAVARRLETDLGIRFGETTADGLFSLDWVGCLGLCDQGPALLVGDRAYSQVTVEKVHEILEECQREAADRGGSAPEGGP